MKADKKYFKLYLQKITNLYVVPIDSKYIISSSPSKQAQVN